MTILDNRGPSWTLSDYLGSIWTILHPTRPFLTILDHVGPILTIFNKLASFCTISKHYGPFWNILGHLDLNFVFCWKILNHLWPFQSFLGKYCCMLGKLIGICANTFLFGKYCGFFFGKYSGIFCKYCGIFGQIWCYFV